MTRQVIRKPHSTAAAYKTSAISSSPTQAESILLAHEQHDSPAQLAERWVLSPDFIRDLFKREVGVIIINRPRTAAQKGVLDHSDSSLGFSPRPLPAAFEVGVACATCPALKDRACYWLTVTPIRRIASMLSASNWSRRGLFQGA